MVLLFLQFRYPPGLVNARTNDKLFIETFLKHCSRMETWQIDRFDCEIPPQLLQECALLR